MVEEGGETREVQGVEEEEGIREVAEEGEIAEEEEEEGEEIEVDEGGRGSLCWETAWICCWARLGREWSRSSWGLSRWYLSVLIVDFWEMGERVRGEESDASPRLQGSSQFHRPTLACSLKVRSV